MRLADIYAKELKSLPLLIQQSVVEGQSFRVIGTVEGPETNDSPNKKELIDPRTGGERGEDYPQNSFGMLRTVYALTRGYLLKNEKLLLY